MQFLEVPQQTNGSDCGVFVCQFCECLADGRPLDFTQADIPDRRLKMVRKKKSNSFSRKKYFLFLDFPNM